ncbi:uncharacterized protein LOC143372230 [Andrena cerasifolii]|uniref:uncharacterized protein LOC143372230 n=1 Tax=Andrena cerasifolii TaxID=2819439 RepID=UPI0040381A76
MIATGRSLSLVSALLALALLVIMETSVVTSYSAFVSDVQLKGKGDGEEVQEGFDGKRNASDSEKRKIIRVPLLPGRHQDRDRRSIDTADETINEYEGNRGYGRKSEGNATASGNKAFSAGDMSAVVSKGAKKNHKKLKLAQMRGKNSGIKEHSRDRGSGKSIGDRSLKEISKRHVDYNTGGEASAIGNTNQISVDQAKQNRNADYYARRRAVMQKYYARQQEIATKYADQASTTARPISRYDLLAEIDNNKVSSPVNIDRRRLHEEESAANRYNGLDANSYGSSTTQVQKQIRDTETISPDEGNGDAEDSEYYDDDYDKEPETTQSPQSNQSTEIQYAPETNIVRGNCLQGTLLYQHNLNLHVNTASSVATDIQVSTYDWYCIACISVQSPKKINSKFSIATTNGSNGGQNTVKLTAASIQEEQLLLSIKIFIVRKNGDHCDPI